MKKSLRASAPVLRRDFLKGVFGVLSATGLGATAASAAEAQPYSTPAQRREGKPPDFPAKLRITKLETLLVKPRWLFLKIHTDQGVIGLGEPILEGRAKTCAAAVAEVEPYLVGKDPRAVVHHWQAIYRHAFYRGGPLLTSALSGIDQALWDIKGKLLGDRKSTRLNSSHGYISYAVFCLKKKKKKK